MSLPPSAGDHGGMAGRKPAGLFGGIFDRGGVDTGDRAWLQAMLDTEAALARVTERAGLAPAGSGAHVTAAARADRFDVDDLGRLAATAGTPVPALVRALSEAVPEAAREAVHRGATSQDIIDTAAMLLSGRALDAILADLASAAGSAEGLARQHRKTVMIGRTLLQQAVPVTFGLVAAGWLDGLTDATAWLRRVREERLAVQFGGAAGTLSALGGDGPRLAAALAAELGLPAAPLPWHASRLRVIELASALAAAGGALGKIARDVTLLAQSEVAEVTEAAPGGSSAMPHKRNPVASVALLACARQLPGLLATLVASAEQEHQRAAGAWQAEWQPLTAMLRLTGSAASWGAELLAGLRVDAARMLANLDASGGLPMAERLAALLSPALGRLAAHEVVAEASARAAARGTALARALDEVLEEARAAPGASGARTTLAGAAQRLAEAGIGAGELAAALDPAGYLGASEAFIDAALARHGNLQD
jgi:3-carboxy-cis,cis-muconate cycloisomerase